MLIPLPLQGGVATSFFLLAGASWGGFLPLRRLCRPELGMASCSEEEFDGPPPSPIALAISTVVHDHLPPSTLVGVDIS